MLQLRDGQGPATATYRADYTAPAYWIDTVDLCFDLDPAKTRVLNKMRLRRNPGVAAQALKLDGEELNLARVLVNGQGTSFKMEDSQLVLDNLPDYEAKLRTLMTERFHLAPELSTLVVGQPRS